MNRPSVLPDTSSEEKSSLAVDTAGEAKVRRVIFLRTGHPLNRERAQASLAMPLSRGKTMLVLAYSGTIVLWQLRDAGIALEGMHHLAREPSFSIVYVSG
jgi:hypothetical protein